MKLERMYLATWLQRTTVHLEEIHNFFTRNFDQLILAPEVLEGFHQDINAKNVIFNELNDFDILRAEMNGMDFLATEDGVLMLSAKVSSVAETRETLERYYEGHLGPAIAYLFSRGAPLPKQLAALEEVYPILLVVRNASQKEIDELFAQMGDECSSFVQSGNVQIFFGKTFHVVRLLKNSRKVNGMLDDLLANVIFLREYDKQLRGYLNLHRVMWDEVSQIRESKTVRYRDFPAVRKKIMDFLKTLSFVKARLSQMADINIARRDLLRPEVKDELKAMGLGRFENELADQKYIADLWQMTIEYVKGTLDLLESLFQENTQRELNTLKFFTLIAATTSFFGMNIAFPWEERWPDTYLSSAAVVALIVSVCFLFYFALKEMIYNRYFVIQDSASFPANGKQGR